MKKIFTFLAVAALAVSAQAKVEVTYNNASITDGEVVKLHSEVLEEYMGIGYELAETFTVNGIAPIQVSVSSDSNKWSYCAEKCYPWVDETSAGKGYTIQSEIKNVPQEVALDAAFIPAMEIPEVDWTINLTFTDADSTLSFSVNLNTISGAVNGIIDDFKGETAIYNIQGMKMMNTNNLPSGIYIRSNGIKTEKFVVK